MVVFLIITGIVLVFVASYLLLIMPRIIGKPDMTPYLGWLYAHRGLHDNKSEAPENSLAAFDKAVAAGFGIELDIQLTKDGQVVVFHDDTLKRVCGIEGKISDYTYEQLQEFHLCESKERIPLFTQVLQMVDGRVPLIVEFKGNNSIRVDLCPVADAILQKYKGVYCMESFNPLMVAWYRKNRPEVVRGQLSERFFSNGRKTVLYFVLENLLLNFYAKPDFIAYKWSDYKNISRRLCRNLYGITAVTWTIQNQESYEVSRRHFDLFIFDSFIPEDRNPNR